MRTLADYKSYEITCRLAAKQFHGTRFSVELQRAAAYTAKRIRMIEQVLFGSKKDENTS